MNTLDTWVTRLGWLFVFLAAIYFVGSVALR